MSGVRSSGPTEHSTPRGDLVVPALSAQHALARVAHDMALRVWHEEDSQEVVTPENVQDVYP